MIGFLLVDEDNFTVDEAAAAKQLGESGRPVLDAALSALEPVDDWTAAGIEQALRSALVDGLGLKPRNAYGPVRVAITGRTVSPPLFESMEILGRERSVARLRAAAA
jgi:glutamyl-tRNA synthetase